MDLRYQTASVPASALARTTGQLESSRSTASPCARSPTCVFHPSAGNASRPDSRWIVARDWPESARAIRAASSADCARVGTANARKKTEMAPARKPYLANHQHAKTVHRRVTASPLRGVKMTGEYTPPWHARETATPAVGPDKRPSAHEWRSSWLVGKQETMFSVAKSLHANTPVVESMNAGRPTQPE